MSYKIFLSVFALLCFFAAPAQKAIICLTYDDGLNSHLKTVIPQLDSFGLKATFFLNSIQGASDKIGESSPAVTGWRNAAINGHELGNHTLFHPCPEKLGWNSEVAVERYTIARIVAEIRAQDALLKALDTTRTVRSYAYPCNNTIVAGTDYGKLIIQQKLVSFCRAGGDSTSIVTDPKKVDKTKVPSWLVEEGTSLQQLIRFAEKAKESNGMAIYQFHGIGGEFFRVDADTHKAFLKYLADHSSMYRVMTFSEAVSAAR